MNKKELIESIAGAADISKAAAEKALNATLTSVADALKKGDKVKIIISRPKKYILTNEQITNIIKKCRKIKDFDKFGNEKIMVFLLITSSIINQKAIQKKTEMKNEKIIKKGLINQFGGKFMKDYENFMKILEKNHSVLSILKSF